MTSLFNKILYYGLLFIVTYLLFVYPSEVIELLILNGEIFILKSLKRVTNNYEGYEISNCGHWVAEEEPELISEYIIKFFNKK